MKYVFTFLAACIFSFSNAQEDLKEIKNDIGFNTNIILSGLFNTGGGSYNLMYKRQIAPNKALRYGLNFSVNLNSHSSGGTNYYYITNYYNINPSIGKEWQLSITKKWMWYYGGDFRLNLYNYTTDNYQNNSLSSTNQTGSYGLSFVPFLGLRFVATERLYFSTEANLSIGYSYQKNKNITYDFNGVSTVNQDYATNTVFSNTGSAVGVFIFYRF